MLHACQGLAGPGRVERGDQRGLGRQFLWESSCYHTVIPYQGLVPRSCLQLEDVVTACQEGMCVFLCVYVHVGKFVCECRGHLQLPNFRGHAWASIGKSSRCMGHSALTVSLGAFIQT